MSLCPGSNVSLPACRIYLRTDKQMHGIVSGDRKTGGRCGRPFVHHSEEECSLMLSLTTLGLVKLWSSRCIGTRDGKGEGASRSHA